MTFRTSEIRSHYKYVCLFRHREVIQKRPQVLKIANLKRIGELFRHENPKAPCPFYAGFGNRTSDVETYRAIGIPDSHIFIVNPEGVIETSTGIKLPTGYTTLCEMIDLVFPPDHQILSGSLEYSDFSFWRDTLPTLTNAWGWHIGGAAGSIILVQLLLSSLDFNF